MKPLEDMCKGNGISLYTLYISQGHLQIWLQHKKSKYGIICRSCSWKVVMLSLFPNLFVCQRTIVIISEGTIWPKKPDESLLQTQKHVVQCTEYRKLRSVFVLSLVREEITLCCGCGEIKEQDTQEHLGFRLGEEWHYTSLWRMDQKMLQITFLLVLFGSLHFGFIDTYFNGWLF